MPPPQRQRPASFVTIKGGYYSLEDTEKLDDGFIVNLSWTQFVAKNFASELEIGRIEREPGLRGIGCQRRGQQLLLRSGRPAVRRDGHPRRRDRVVLERVRRGGCAAEREEGDEREREPGHDRLQR